MNNSISMKTLAHHNGAGTWSYDKSPPRGVDAPTGPRGIGHRQRSIAGPPIRRLWAEYTAQRSRWESPDAACLFSRAWTMHDACPDGQDFCPRRCSTNRSCAEVTRKHLQWSVYQEADGSRATVERFCRCDLA